MTGLSRYRKAVAALLGSAVTWAGTAYVPDGSIDRNEWYGLAVVALTALGVYGIPNDAPKGQAPDPLESVRDLTPNEAVTSDTTADDGHPQSAANYPPPDWADDEESA